MFAESPAFIRRLIRFALLPYCYINLVNWSECRKSKLQVLKDLLFIFFRLKYYPDNYGACRLYEKSRKEWVCYYGSTYNPYPRRQLRILVQQYDYQIIFNDKELWEKFCHAMPVVAPPFLGTVEPTGPYREQIRAILTSNETNRIIIKPVKGHAGQGIILALREDGEIVILTGSGKIYLDDLTLATKCIIQKVVEQDSSVSEIYPCAVNTVRIITLLTADQDVILIGAKMRFGNNKSFIDNSSAGGINVGIDKRNGILNEFGYDKHGNRYRSHPATGVDFAGYNLPRWGEIVDLAKIVQRECSFYKLVGTDIAVTPDGPVLIEANANPDIIGLELAIGPILRDRVVYDEFKRYDLLINIFQQRLHS